MGDPTSTNNVTNLYSSRASVFRVNPETKRSWLTIGDKPINISFVAASLDPRSLDKSTRKDFKLIGIGESGNVMFEAAMLYDTSFTKRSQKFCQWNDQTGNVYGLGFGSELELNEFLDTFQELQSNLLSQPAPHGRTASSIQPQPRSSGLLEEKWNRDQELQKQINTNTHSETTNGRPSIAGTSNLSWAHAEAGNTTSSAHQESTPIEENKRLSQFQALTSNANKTDLSTNGSGNFGHDRNNNVSSKSILNESGANYSRSQSMFGLEGRSRSGSRGNINTNTSTSNLTTERTSPEGPRTSPSTQLDWQKYEQLKVENERLKRALEESTKNSDLWQNELLTLRTNNVRLTHALQQSKANVQQWEHQLSQYKEENKELNRRLEELYDATNESDKSSEYKKDLQKYKNYVEEVQVELSRKQTEVDQLQRSMEEMQIQRNGKQSSDSLFSQQKQRLDVINARLEAKVGELLDVQKEFGVILDKLNQ